jgi:hypothetical protein
VIFGGAFQINHAKDRELKITRAGSQASTKEPADWFIGAVRVDPLFRAPDLLLNLKAVFWLSCWVWRDAGL